MDGPPSTPACLCAATGDAIVICPSEGESFQHMCPMSLRIMMGDRVLHETIIKQPVFHIKEPLWQDSIPANDGEIVEVGVYADTSFSPQDFGIDDTRALSYRVHKLALVDEQGDEFVLYSERRAWLLRMALSLLVLWKSLLINHAIPYKELGTDLRQLRLLLHRFLAILRSGDLSR